MGRNCDGGGIVYSAAQETQVVSRCPLVSNSPSNVYNELRDPRTVNLLLGKITKPPIPVSVVFGGDDFKFTCVILFLYPELGHFDEIMRNVAAFAELRWRGLSRETATEWAVEMAGDGEPVKGADLERKLALKKVAPWLPYNRLRPMGPTGNSSINWASPHTENVFIFRDSDVSFVVYFEETDGRFNGIATVYTIDSQEFLERTREDFQTAAREAWNELGAEFGNAKRRCGPGFWAKIRALLKKKGIEWMSPEELNHDIAFG